MDINNNEKIELLETRINNFQGIISVCKMEIGILLKEIEKLTIYNPVGYKQQKKKPPFS